MRGIRRSKNHSHIVDLLDQKSPDTGRKVFPFKKATMCFAAVLGFENSKRTPLSGSEFDSIEWHTFSNGGYTDYIYLIALAEAKNLGVLRYDVQSSSVDGPNEDMVAIFEEYANGGFEIIQSWLNKMPSDPFGAQAIIAGLKRDGFLQESSIKPNTEFENEVF